MRTLFQLFLDLFRISLFVVGGGYAIIAVADDVFAKRGWTKEGEILDNLREASSSIRDFANDLKSNPSILLRASNPERLPETRRSEEHTSELQSRI